MNDDDKALHVRQLEAGYGERSVVQGVDLHVRAGECVAILGPNGAGKSTTIRAVAGMLRPVRGGEISVNGVRRERASASEMVAAGVRLVPEGRRLFTRMTVADNVALGGYTLPSRRDRARRVADSMALFPSLERRQKQMAGSLSGGERQMLAVARALVTSPEFLLLDEPSMGLAPTVIQDLGAIFRQLLERGAGIVLVEQNVGLALDVASRLYILSQGRVTQTLQTADVGNSQELMDAYLGAAPEAPGGRKTMDLYAGEAHEAVANTRRRDR